MQKSHIATQIENFDLQNLQHQKVEALRIANKKLQTVDKYLGKERFDRLLSLENVAYESGLTNFWSRIANPKKRNQLTTLETFIESEKEAFREYHLTFLVDNDLLITILSPS